MPIAVRAQVVDIRTDVPTTEDLFFVDTNAWYWLTYNRASLHPEPPQPYQVKSYPDYLKLALTNGAKLLWCGFSFAELAHSIEKTEREIYANQANREIQAKEYRHGYPNQRRKVTGLITEAWEQVTSLGAPLAVSVDEEITQSAASRIQNVGLDGYDLFIIEAMQRNGINQIITDDGDYSTVSGIIVFTANQHLIEAARSANRLITRQQKKR